MLFVSSDPEKESDEAQEIDRGEETPAVRPQAETSAATPKKRKRSDVEADDDAAHKVCFRPFLLTSKLFQNIFFMRFSVGHRSDLWNLAPSTLPSTSIVGVAGAD